MNLSVPQHKEQRLSLLTKVLSNCVLNKGALKYHNDITLFHFHVHFYHPST